MTRLISLFALLIALTSCDSIETSNSFNRDMTFAKTMTKPITLSFRDNKHIPFYFLLSKESNKNMYRITVRWKNPRKDELLFDGANTTLKFLIDNQYIYTFKPVKKTRVVAYNINESGQEEEGVFDIPEEMFNKIVYAKITSVELRGKEKIVVGEFNRYNTRKAFKDFYEKSL